MNKRLLLASALVGSSLLLTGMASAQDFPPKNQSRWSLVFPLGELLMLPRV